MGNPAAMRRTRLAARLAGSLLAALLVTIGGCADEGVTPTCKQDVEANGHADVEGGCNPFGLCIINGKAAAPAECCKDFPKGYDFEACMYGYGAGPKPGSGASGSGGAGGSGSASGAGGN
jgi:hypothetical protein